jgi:hypothetical protein
MRLYLVVSGGIFMLILAAHAVRVAIEGRQLALEPSFAVSSAAALGMCIWAGVLFRRAK